MLRDIRGQLCGPNFDKDVLQSVDLMLDWIRDLKSIDPIAMWCWDILKRVYVRALSAFFFLFFSFFFSAVVFFLPDPIFAHIRVMLTSSNFSV